MNSALDHSLKGAKPLPEQIALLDDPFILCLEYAAEYFGLPFSRRGALAGLPVDGARLKPSLFVRTAEQAGFRAQLNKIKLSKLPGLVLPVVVFLRDGGACLIVKRLDGDRYLVVDPSSRDTMAMDQAELQKIYSGYALFLTPASQAGGVLPAKPRRSGHWFWSTVLRFWTSGIQIVLGAFFVNLLGLAVPLFTMNVYDRVIPNMSIPTLWALAIGVGLALLFDGALRQMRSVVLDIVGRRVDLHISSKLFEHALALSMSARKASSGMIANQIREFEAVRDFFTSASIIAVTDLLFLGIFIFVLWHLVGEVALVPLLAILIVLSVTLLLQIPLARSMRLTQFQSSRRHSILIESLGGIESIKAANAEGVMQRRWEDAVAASARASSSARIWSSFASYFTSLVQQAVSVGTIVWGVFLVREGTLTIGGLIAASLIASRLLAPLGNIAMTLSRAQQAFTAMRAITDLMSLSRESPPDSVKSGIVGDGRLEFRGVTFRYEGQDKPALGEVSFRIAQGERVGIIGRIGSGKTTIGKLAAGFYAPQDGSILVSGADSRVFEPSDLRATVGYVPQEAELFTGTIRDNILLGRPHATPEEIQAAVRLSGVEAFTATHPMGLNLPIGERGRGLSGGQRQAVALARMLLHDPTILFLDEPSSALDSATEGTLVRDLASWAGSERTLIVCTHRGQLLNLVERLIVLEAGRVVADGKKDEVIALLARSQTEAAARAGGSP